MRVSATSMHVTSIKGSHELYNISILFCDNSRPYTLVQLHYRVRCSINQITQPDHENKLNSVTWPKSVHYGRYWCSCKQK